MEFCQSCQQNEIEVSETCDDKEFPYKVCKPCHHRLLNKALRPLEFFNIKAKHGEAYLLHDDFYDENGIADQPYIEVIEDSSLKFPKLSEIKNDLEEVVDYAIVQYWLDDEVVQILLQFDKQLVLNSLDKRINENRNLDYKIYPIVAKVLRSFANDWVRKKWKSHTEIDFTLYAEMLANCLPLEESYGYLTKELEKISSPSKLNESLHCLVYLQTEKSLDWIEKNIYKMQSLSSSWGFVAAASKFSWDRAKKWLNDGRPLSLISLDALQLCSVTEDSWGKAIWFRENPQKLLQPDSVENMNKVLTDYLQKDNVPRTRTLINFITENWNKILENAT